jgi:uncharacterized protein YjiS (DUF1127 family)
METTMSNFSRVTMPRAFGGDSLSRRVGQALKRCWLAYLDWRLQRLAINRLRSMSDRELKDVGLTRSQIESHVRGRPARHATLTQHPF